MHPTKIIVLEVICFVILYVLIYYFASHYRPTNAGDAAGSGMARGFLLLSIIAVFFFIAIGLSVINYFLLKEVTNPGITFLSFIPLVISGAHVLYTLIFG